MNALPAVMASIVTVCAAYLTAPFVETLHGVGDAVAVLFIFSWIIGHGVVWFLCAGLFSRIMGVR